MNRPNNQKNYAQAAAQPKSHINNTHHQNQQHHHQQSSQQNQTSGTSTSSNFSPSTNGKPNNKSQTKPQAQHNSTMGNGNTGRSAPIKHKNNPVQLPANGHAWEKAPPIEFGSINTPNAQLSTSTGPTLTSGGGIPATLSTKVVPFGTLSNTTTQTTQAIQASTTVGTTGPGANNNSSNSNNNSNNNNGASKQISGRPMDIIPRTHSAPPQFQDNRNVGQSGHMPNMGPARTQPNNAHQQQSAVVSHQQPSISVSNPPLNHRKDSVSSTVSSNDGQQQPFHPHHSTHHPPNHNNHNNQHYRQHHKNSMGPNQYRPRDKNMPQHLNHAQPVPTQGTMPMTHPTMYMYNREYAMAGYYPYVNPMVIQPYPPPYGMHPRPPQMTQSHMPQTPPPVNNTFKPPNTTKQSKAIEIIDPNKNAPINFTQFPPKIHQKREEAPVVYDKKPEESDKEKPSSEDKGNSKAVPIVDPADKEERERKEQERISKEKEEKERKEQEEKERLEKERLETERREKEEKERREKEEQERKEREERERLEAERKEKEEKERKEREERERLEAERKEKEEKERKEREERERLEAERKEKEEKERKEREERERLEAERKEKEEKERKEREERERLEAERKEKEEKERKEREERERLEKERKEKEEKERKEQEEKERLEKERLEAERREKEERERKEEEEKARKQQEEREKEEIERKKKEEEEAKAKAAAEDEKKKEVESADSKKEEKKFNKGHRPGPLDLSRTTSAPAIPSAPLSALGSARIIDDLNSVQYPEGILSPNPALNSNAEPGKFKYDRNFLMQFMGVCKEKPENLPALEAIGMEEPKDDKKRATRNGTNSRSSLHKSSPTQFQMGEFKFPPKTSEERFALSNNMRNGTSSGAGIFGRAPLGRTGSGSTLLPAPAMSTTATQSPSRTPSGRPTTRRSGKGSHQVQGPNMGQEQVAPLERSENRWVPSQMADPLPNKTNENFIPIEGVQRKVKALLNKLTLEKFDSISDQIIDYANKSRDEKDGRILREVIRLIFEKSCDESNFCAMYAQLCRKMMERVDPEIIDENVKNTEGKFVQGGTLFRKYLLNRCQEDFEKGWKVNVPVPSNEKGEPDLMSDEYYAAAKAKRQGLGLIRFIGELFKLNMLTERIMHECIKKLLIFQGSPEEEEMESLCKLMNTVGEQLDHVKTSHHEHVKQNQIDHAKAKQLMESYFNRMEEITKLPNLSSRIKFMIMDVIDLRNNSWKPRRDINAPKTIAEIHEDAAKQKEEAEFLRRTASSGGRLPKMAEQMSRSGSGRRDHRSDKGMAPHGPASSNDGWINVGGTSQRNKDKVGDLTKFGSVNRSKITGNVSLAPGGILTGLSGGAKGWNSEKDGKNMYSVLTSENSEGRKSSEMPSSEGQKSSPPTERRKIILAPRTKAIPTEEPQATTKSVSRSNSDAVQPMPEETAKKKIIGMMEEYFSICDIKEVVQCLKEIPAEYHANAIESFANKVIEKKQKEVDNVMKLFREIVSSRTCELDAFKNGFRATLDFLVDIGADAPMSYSFTGQLLFSTGLDFRDITKLLKQLDDEKAIEKIVRGYASALKKDDEQKYVQKIGDFDFTSLFPKKNKDDINKYLEDLVR